MGTKLNARREKILQLLGQVPISSTPQLAEATGVSTETMRKDLDALADEGQIIKVHGGVALANSPASKIPFDLRAGRNVVEKRRIARAAVELVQPGDSVVLESCTTNLELAKALCAKPDLLETLVVITNSFSVASLFECGGRVQKMFFLGGWMNPGQYSASGNQTAKMLGEFRASKAFLSGAAVTDNWQITGYYDDDVAFQKQALQAAEKIVLMVDSSKFGQSAILSVAPLAAVDYLVTDRQLNDDQLEAVAGLGVRVVKA